MHIMGLKIVQTVHIPHSCPPKLYFQLLQKLAFTLLPVSDTYLTHHQGANIRKTQTAYRILVNGKNIHALCTRQLIYTITKT